MLITYAEGRISEMLLHRVFWGLATSMASTWKPITARHSDCFPQLLLRVRRVRWLVLQRCMQRDVVLRKISEKLFVFIAEQRKGVSF